MAREDGFEGRDPIGVRFLDATEEGFVDVCGVVGVAVALGYDAGVYAGGVRV